MSTEAQKRASKKYFLTHREYYREKTKESIKKIRQERKEYKQRIDEAIEILERDYHIKGEDRDLYEALTGKKVWEENNEYNK